MIIDWQHHFTPKEVYEKHSGKPGEPVYKEGKVVRRMRVQTYQVEDHLKFMDAAGIDMAVLSTTWTTNFEDQKIISESFGKLMKQYPDRFIGLAPCVPTLGRKALEELDKAIHRLGLKGVAITPQVEGVPLDSEKLYPFYERVSKLDIPIFVHVTDAPIGYDAFNAKYNLDVTLAREFDVANAVARVILGGVMVKFPSVQFVFSHMGGGITAVKDRLDRYVSVWGHKFWSEMGGTPPFPEPYGENFDRYFKKLYFDMAGFEGRMNVVKCALTAITPERLLFATDYPPNFTDDPMAAKTYIDKIKNLELPSESIEAMLGGNASKLLKI
jgi:predicted TIM-barrel fold metal-dependent hydrolase